LLRGLAVQGKVRNEHGFPSLVAGPVRVFDAGWTDMSAVLLVEDELLVRELASEDLSDAGFEVTAASDGDEALGYLREGRRFDLLFTDIRMPGATDGWQLARKAREILPEIREIYATGLGDAADDLAEGEHYVRKPYSLGDLHKALAQLGFAGGGAA
jgi:CheY-like chemotaxis protein